MFPEVLLEYVYQIDDENTETYIKIENGEIVEKGTREVEEKDENF